MNVSVLLLTYNEENNLPACLSSLTWCDDIVIVDSGSQDRSVELAQLFGARVLHRKFDNFAEQRNYGLDEGAFRHEWILHLDADELVTLDFQRDLNALVPSMGIDGFQVPSKMMLFGRWLKHAGMWPSYQVRLGHRDRLRFKQVGHGQREDAPASRIGIFLTPYEHYSFSHGLSKWFEKHIRYAADEASLMLDRTNGYRENVAGGVGIRRRLKNVAMRLPVVSRPLARFFYIYFVRQGFRDGLAGLAYALMLSVYEGMIAVFVLEGRIARRSGMRNPER